MGKEGTHATSAGLELGIWNWGCHLITKNELCGCQLVLRTSKSAGARGDVQNFGGCQALAAPVLTQALIPSSMYISLKKGLGLHIVIVIYAVASGHNVLKRPRLLAINTWGVSVCKMTKLLFKDNQAYRRRRDSTLAPHCGGGRVQQLPQKKGFARVTLLNIVDSIHIQLVPCCCWLLTFGRL